MWWECPIVWRQYERDREADMTALTEIVRNVLVIVLVAGFLEMLLPEGNMKPLVRLCIGMFILIAVLNPVLNFFFNERDFQIGSWDYQPEQAEPVIDIETEGARINRAMLDQSQKVARAKLEEQINAVAVLVPGVEKVAAQVEIDEKGKMQNLMLSVSTGTEEVEPDENKSARVRGKSRNDDETRERLENKIIDLIHNLYGFEESTIKINFEGG